MYSRNAQGRFPRDMRIPKNYAGNAFSQIEQIEETEETERESAEAVKVSEEIEREAKNDSAESTKDKCSSSTALLSRTPKFNLGLGKLFSKGGINIGFEELLLIGLILLISSEGGGDDLILLLLLLLFIQ